MAAPSAPRLTVVIPTYNRARWLPVTLDNVLEQDIDGLEVVVIDDGSTDATPGILRGYAARHPGRLRYARQPNTGQSAATNRGLTLARAPLIALLDDDDLVLPGGLEALMDALEERPDAVAAFGDMLLTDEDGRELKRVAALDFDLPEILALLECTIGVPLLRREPALATQLSTTLVAATDLDFFLRLALRGPLVRVPRVVSCWRQHADSHTSRRADDRLAYAESLLNVVKRFYALPDLPPEVLDVKTKAYRTAFYRGGVFCRPQVNEPGERFIIHDTLVERIYPDGA